MKYLQFILYPAIGAFLAWIIFEPWSEDYGYIRDLLLFFALALFIVISVLSRQGIRFRKWNLVKRALTNKWVYIIPFVGALLIKVIFTQRAGSSDACAQDEETNKVILLLDVSSSMKGEGIEELKDAITSYFDLLKCADSQDQVACVTFNTDDNLLFDYTTNYSKATSEIRGLRASGGTNMTSGFTRAYDVAQRFDGTDVSIVLVSDGAPNSAYDVQQLVLNNESTPVNTVGVGYGYNRDLLEYLSEETQGEFFQANNIESLTNVFQQIANKQGGGITQVTGDGKDAIVLPIWKRILGWVLLGFFIGLAIGKADARPEMKYIAVIGALIGGLLSAIVFVALDHLDFDSGTVLRAVTFVLYGAIIGIAIAFVNQLYTKGSKQTPFERKNKGLRA